MLTHLTLINFALADHLAIDIEQGFNVLTGETGAGKSLLLDALSACLGERTDTNYVRYGSDKADVTAVFTYQDNSPEAKWLKEHELDDDSGEIHLRRVIFATGRSKAWVNGRPSSLSELKELGRLLVQLYSQHSQQQLLEPPYPKHWLDRYSNFYAEANDVREAYSTWQRNIRQHQAALDAQATRLQRIATLELQIEELEEVIQTDYKEIEQEFDRLSHHEHIMQDCSYSLNALDEAEQNITQEMSSIIRRLESHAGRSEQLSEIYNSLLNAQSEIDDATSNLRQFIDRQSFDPERMEELNSKLEVFHRLARKYRTQPETLKEEYETWQSELEQLHQLEDPETLAEQVEKSHQEFLEKAQHLDNIRREAASPLAKQLTEQVKPLALPEAHFEFKFEPLEQPNAEGLSFIQLLFTANKGIPPQPLARVASGGELSRIALVMQVMNAEKTEAEVLVFDEIDVGISGGTAEVVGRLLADLAQHVQLLCITHQAQVAAQSDQHLLVKKQQTDPASSTIVQLDENQIISELARMSGGVEINETTLQHAKQLRQLKFQASST
ncbi:TPA: DNA repair protein RecN [Acinetobacter baumannii]|uniref:DNA repair protein RecN n=14 Tax=Gammaproteobacteria TaxID=1236 RepID=A0A059ZGS1_ACIBA|nr:MULTISPECIES: DNA repair protein RecN [Acinetobacter]ADX90804.1 ATPase [Acinetobacter baumannii TCDC-AB0715]AHX30392.1 DNA strand exchange inhibitor protein [Acinetobacter baumannii AC12]AHX65346.1 DNA strand exchange inhibitor protein [Acinetobacter baumannii AC30]EMT93637.1 Recombination and DNA repair protein [Acinetobacter baumannii ABNIH5]ETY67832.1 DNA strand exchange inhibitor protein [Acinetobacter baumannii MDR_MMC4]EXB11690.1 DNA repair protein RecN [Acinetobacter baumannii 13970